MEQQKKESRMIGERYELVKLIGQGGMGRVYKALDTHLDRFQAVKEVSLNDTRQGQQMADALKKEVEILRLCDHRMLPHIEDFITEEDAIYIVMELVDGITLESYLKKHGPLHEKQVVLWGKELANGLSYLHGLCPPIIYGDLKPSNIMVKPDGNLKLFDFGTAYGYIPGQMDNGLIYGTYGYASPEQCGGIRTRELDLRSDIYSLGVVLNVMLTGDNPMLPHFHLENVREVNSALSKTIEKIINRCTRIQPGKRYASAKELEKALKTAGNRRINNLIEGIKLGICLILLGISAYHIGTGIEIQKELWQFDMAATESGLLVFIGAILWNRVFLKVRRQKRFILSKEVDILWTEKSGNIGSK